MKITVQREGTKTCFFKDGLVYNPVDDLKVRPVDAELIIKEG